MKYIAEVDGLDFLLEIIDEHHVRFGDEILDVDLATVSNQPIYSLLVNGESFEGYISQEDERWLVHLLGQSYQVVVEDEQERRIRTASKEPAYQGTEYTLRAPMPGLIISIAVQDDEIVGKGQTLAVLESMKMQNELKAPFSGRVARIRINVGEIVERKQILMVITTNNTVLEKSSQAFI
jgi:biotin carboxyl carrier protein